MNSRVQADTSSNLEELALATDAQSWFHAIDFGSFQSVGRFESGTPQNRTLYGVFDLIRAMDLRRAHCLDIGTADGLLAFGMKTLGAAKVTAADTYALPTFALARQILDLEIDYQPNLQVKDLPGAFAPATFDLIACAGIIYHMLNPFAALLTCRRLVKEGGYVLIETAYAPGDDTPTMIFNPEAEDRREINTYWMPTRRTLEGMLRTVCFEVVATRVMARMPRIAVLGRAVKPAEVSGRTATMQRIHEADFCDHEFRLQDVFATPRATSTITMAAVAPYEKIDPETWSGTYPHHPRTLPNPKGRSVFAAAAGNP